MTILHFLSWKVAFAKFCCREILYYLEFHEITFLRNFNFCYSFHFFSENVKTIFQHKVAIGKVFSSQMFITIFLINNCFDSFSVNEAGFLVAEKMLWNKILWFKKRYSCKILYFARFSKLNSRKIFKKCLFFRVFLKTKTLV